MNIDKIPPQAIDIEEAVLGGIITELTYQDTALELLEVDDFYREAHQLIFKAIKSLKDKGIEIDMITVVQELKKDNRLDDVGGAYYITQITSKISNAINIEYWCRILNEKKISRHIIEICSKYLNSCYNDFSDPLDLSENLLKEVEIINQSFSKHKNISLSEIQKEHYEEVNKRVKLRESGELAGIKTPLRLLTFNTRGWQQTDLVIIAARPSMGKTAFAIECITVACQLGKSVVFFSLEMSAKQIMDRIYMTISGLTSEELRYGCMTEESYIKYHDAVNQVSKWKLIIDDKSGIDVSYIKSKLKKFNDVDMVVIDYLQIMSMQSKRNSTTDQDISEVTMKLKCIAKEFSIPIILLSQLSRECEKRTNKRPQLSDLRSSGSIEQDADIVIFLYRDAYYGIKENEVGEDTTGLIEIDIKKHRNGSITKIVARHNETLTKFYDKDFEDISENKNIVPSQSFYHPEEYKTDFE